MLASALVTAAATVLWTDVPRDGGNQAEPEQRAIREPGAGDEWRPNETAAKKRLVERDVALTGELCNRQCRSDLGKMARELSGLPSDEAKKQLEKFGSEHHRMVMISWRTKDGQTIRTGGLPGGAGEELEKGLKEAERAVLEGKAYDTGRITAGTDTYVILGVPWQDKGGIVGVVRQSVLGRVHKQQTENLRLVPYPREGRYNIESVDTRTHRDITVDHGEENGIASHYHKQEVVVKFLNPPGEDELDKFRRDLGITAVRKTGYAYVFQSERSTAEEMIDYFRKSGNTLYAEPHYLYMTNTPVGPVDADLMPNDELFAPYQWNLPIIGTIPGWAVTRGNEDTLVAVIDTGVDLTHDDLKGRLADGANFIDPDEEPLDDVGHGTHVTGVISATVNNAVGVAGMTWYDRVMPIKVLDATGAGSAYSVAEGIIWATDHGAKVINMSLGNYAESEFLHDALKYAYDHDVVLVAATGNDNTDQPGYPAAYPEVLGVSAIDDRQRLADFSNYGDYVDVVAPGVSIASTYPDGQYAALSGTSMASPHVAALAALIRSVHPLLNNTEVMDIIRRTAIDLGDPGKDPLYGYGQIDVNAALSEAARLKQSVSLYPEWVRRQIESLAP